MRFDLARLLVVFIVLITAGCANIVPPSGGKKDVTPPRLVRTIPADSQLHTRINRVELYFNEYITLSDANSQVHISPILPIPLTVTAVNKKVVIKIPDSLLQDNTTYRLTFGNAIKDLHEGNAFNGYTYTFSTGRYFDSLQLSGTVISAVTGLPDTGTIIVSMYDAAANDSAIVRKKPLYIADVTKSGAFSFKGLPARRFKIYALKDYNNNMMYDGPPEWIGFADNAVSAGDSTSPVVQLRIFKEAADSTTKKQKDSIATGSKLSMLGKTKAKEGFDYSLNLDTSNVRNRSKDINKSIEVSFVKALGKVNADRISLSYDSSGVSISAMIKAKKDSAKNAIVITTPWLENTVYTLKLLKGFAKDTAGADAMPSKYIFRTKRDEDYSKLSIHLSPKYVGSQYILLVKNDKDTVYNKPVADTMVNLVRLMPADYTVMIIIDKNRNGKWDEGVLLEHIQPEEVIPYGSSIPMKAGWDNTIDMLPAVEKPKSKLGGSADKETK